MATSRRVKETYAYGRGLQDGYDQAQKWSAEWIRQWGKRHPKIAKRLDREHRLAFKSEFLLTR